MSAFVEQRSLLLHVNTRTLLEGYSDAQTVETGEEGGVLSEGGELASLMLCLTHHFISNNICISQKQT